ncbi:MAG: recombinase family protein, partial [Myxococcales bacterium]|nr:recombinase family protein [Myxococcales bacterium]
ERVPVIDEDQGQERRAARARAGFGGLVAAVARGEVGIVMSLEVSRLSRNDSDWHHLVYLCRWTGTLIADEHGVYDPSSSADRMVLGIRGQVSGSSVTAPCTGWSRRWSKARRGEAFTIPPAGYDLDGLGQLEMSSDEAVQAAVHRVFHKFESTVPAVRCTCGGASKACRFRASHVAEVASDRLGSGRLPDDPQHAAPPDPWRRLVFGRSETLREPDPQTQKLSLRRGRRGWSTGPS